MHNVDGSGMLSHKSVLITGATGGLGRAMARRFLKAGSDLTLVGRDRQALKVLTEKLQAGTTTHKKAKDILRAARLRLLPVDNPHVAADLSKIKKGQPLSPILVVRGDFTKGVPLQIADGYHRVCASYHTDENTDIPVIIAPST